MNYQTIITKVTNSLDYLWGAGWGIPLPQRRSGPLSGVWCYSGIFFEICSHIPAPGAVRAKRSVSVGVQNGTAKHGQSNLAKGDIARLDIFYHIHQVAARIAKLVPITFGTSILWKGRS